MTESGWKLKNRKFKLLAITLVLFSLPTFGKTPKGTITSQRPESFGIEDKFYLTYFSSVDQSIMNAYVKEWRFHDNQVKYNPLVQKDEHYTMGTIESYGNGKSESSLRSVFAEQVLRMRIDAAVKTYFADKKDSIAKKALDAVEDLKDVRVAAPSNGANQAEFSFGYDVMTDSSKFEYVKGNIEAGIYHPKLTAALMGRSQLMDANLSVWTNMDGRVPRTSISLPISANSFTTSISQPLAANVMGNLATSQPLNNKAASQSYDVSICFLF